MLRMQWGSVEVTQRFVKHLFNVHMKVMQTELMARTIDWQEGQCRWLVVMSIAESFIRLEAFDAVFVTEHAGREHARWHEEPLLLVQSVYRVWPKPCHVFGHMFSNLRRRFPNSGFLLFVKRTRYCIYCGPFDYCHHTQSPSWSIFTCATITCSRDYNHVLELLCRKVVMTILYPYRRVLHPVPGSFPQKKFA